MAKTKVKKLELFVEFKKLDPMDSIIVDQDRNEYSVELAKELWDAGKVDNCNLSFQRLATQAEWNFDKLAAIYKAIYKEMDANK